jgi:hypothetical protein
MIIINLMVMILNVMVKIIIRTKNSIAYDNTDIS